MIPTATSSTSGLMSAAIFNQHVTNTAKVSNATHTGDVTDAAGVLTVNKINGVALSSFPNNTVLKTTTGGIIAAATANDYPTLNQSTTGNALTATTATKSTNIAGGATGSLPYQTANDSTAMLAAGTSGTVLKSNGAAAPSWSAVEKSMLSTALSDEITANTAKNSNVIHTGDVTDTAGVLKVTKINNVSLATLGTGILKNTTGTGTPSIAVAADFPTMTASVGGTGITSYSVGDLLYASSNTTLDKLSDIATGNALLSGGVNNAPSYGKVALSGAVTHITGTLSVANGGTGLSTITGYVKGTGTSALSTSATIPVADISGTLSVANGGTGVTSSTGSGAVVLSNSPSLTTPNLGAPTAGTLTSCTGLPIIDGTTGTLSVTRGGTGNTTLTGYIKGNGTGAMSAVSSVPITDLSGSISVANGGTGQSTFTAGILKSTGGSAALETVTAPNGDLVGTTATQTLTNKTLTAPALDTPISGTLTNCTGLPLNTGVTGTLPVTSGGTGVTAASTGSGGVVLSTSPTLTSPILVTPALGTPASGTLTSCTGLPIINGTTGTLSVARGGTGVTNSTGNGSVVLSNSPSLTTPNLGVPTGGTLTSCTGLPIIEGTTGTLSVARGGTGVTALASGFIKSDGTILTSSAAPISIADGGTGVTQSTYGEYYISSITATSIGTTGTFVKVNGTTTAGFLSNFTHPASNRLTYTGTATRKFLVAASLSFHGTATNDYKFAFHKNTSSLLSPSIISTTGSGAGDLAHISCQTIVELATNDFIEVFVTNADATNSATIDFMNVTAVALI